MKRIDDKIEEIERYLEELLEIVPESLEEYLKDKKSKAACERYAEKIIEAVIDLAFIYIKDNKLKIPEDEEGTFNILQKEEIISEHLAKKLKEAKGMRNFLAHQYGEVNDNIVYEAIKNELLTDIAEFIKLIREPLN